MNSVGCLYATAMYSHFVPNSRQISHRQSLFFAYIFKYPVRHLRETILEIGTSQQLFLLLCKLLYDVTTTTVFSAATAARNCQHRHSLVPGHEYKLLPTLEKLLIGKSVVLPPSSIELVSTLSCLDLILIFFIFS